MPAYETDGFDPPAAVIRGRVRGPAGLFALVPLLIDTGADVSIIPLSIATSVGADVYPSNVPVQFYSGQAITLHQAELTVTFLRYQFHGMYLVADSDFGIIGRNILNSLVVTLDGPRLAGSIAL